MKKRLSKLVRNEKGQGLVIVLGLLAIGTLTIIPLLNHVYTGLTSGQIYSEKIPLSYAADAGLEDGIWKSDNDEESLDLIPLEPYDYVTEYNYSLPEEINNEAVNVTIKQIWPLAGLESDANGTIPASGLSITGGVVNAQGGFEVRISYDTPEELLEIDQVAVWLPPGFEYVTGSSDGITIDNPTEIDWNGGKALRWDFPDVNFLDLPEPGVEDPLEGGMQPAIEHPSIRILRFNVTPAGAVASGSYSWVRTTDSSRYLSWGTSLTIYKINSTATDTTTGKSITAGGYTYVSRGIDTGWIDTGGVLFTGDYRAIGNTLMQDLDHNRRRETLLSESSATISNIPADSEVAFAYLYWSGWRNWAGSMVADKTCTFKIGPETETIRPSADGNYTQCDPYGALSNYQCVDEAVTDEDSTYVQTGYDAKTLRPNAAGNYTECDPYGAASNYQCVDEVVADGDSTYVETGEAEILRPNAAGTYSQCDPYGAASNYQCVDEEVADEGSTYVRTWYGDTELDTYNIADHVVGTGTINSVTVYIRTRATSSGHAVETVIRTYGANHFGTYTSAPTSYTDISTTYTTNPSTGFDWTWDEIDALEIGVKHYDLNGGYLCTTQVYAGVNYGPTSEEEIDTYNIDDYSEGSTVINSVTVYVGCRGTLSGDTHAAQTVIRTHDTNYFGTYTLLPTSYTDLSTTYTTNPYTLSAWTWEEIIALQAGVRQYDLGYGAVRTTQVYVEVDYGPAEGKIDTYNIGNHSEGSGVINSVTVHIRSRGTSSGDTHAAETVIRTHDTNYFGTYTLLPTSYTDLSTTYTTNPSTLSAWTWEEIDALQAGVRQYDLGSGTVRCTQVYVEVDYGLFYEGEITADTWWLVENESPDYSYSCFKDVTDLVTPISPDGNATYAVGGVDGDTETEWSYAGWSLIIIYSSPYEQGHQFFLWDQLLFAGTNDSGSFIIEGFLAPVDAELTLTCFVTEGDDWYDNDSLQLNGYYMSDEVNPAYDVWNSKSSALGGEPIEGVDIDTFDVSSPIVNVGDSSAEVTFTTAQDNWNLVYLILAIRSDSAVLTPSSTGIFSYGLGG